MLAVGALDGLVLEAVLETVPTLARKHALGPTMGKWIKEDPERFLTALASPDPYDALGLIAREHLSPVTFQRAQMIEGVLDDVSACAAPWERAAKRLTKSGGTWTPDDVKTSLDGFVKRRHAIAHSGDLVEGRRAQPITLGYVREATRVIEAAGLGVCEVVEARLRVVRRLP